MLQELQRWMYSSSTTNQHVLYQWTAWGWGSTVSAICSDGNERCVVLCGGNSGGCTPVNNMLQLAWLPPSPPPPSARRRRRLRRRPRRSRPRQPTALATASLATSTAIVLVLYTLSKKLFRPWLCYPRSPLHPLLELGYWVS